MKKIQYFILLMLVISLLILIICLIFPSQSSVILDDINNTPLWTEVAGGASTGIVVGVFLLWIQVKADRDEELNSIKCSVESAWEKIGHVLNRRYSDKIAVKVVDARMVHVCKAARAIADEPTKHWQDAVNRMGMSDLKEKAKLINKFMDSWRDNTRIAVDLDEKIEPFIRKFHFSKDIKREKDIDFTRYFIGKKIFNKDDEQLIPYMDGSDVKILKNALEILEKRDPEINSKVNEFNDSNKKLLKLIEKIKRT